MGNQADIKAVITAEDRASSVLKGFSDSVDGVGGKVAGAAKVAGEAMLAAGAAAVGFGALSVKAFMETEDVQAQLNTVLTSTHHAAGLYIQDLNDQSAALQKVTKFSDEQVGTVQALLLTFTQIHGAVFQQATPAILDLATAMHEDLQSASVQVGKALNDPLTGITALHRIGVTFSDTQKQQIQGFVDTNNLAAAQGVILKELNKEFGGSAEAAGKTFGGQLAILKNKLNDVEETIGSLILKYLVPLVSKISDFVSKVDWQKVIDRSVRSIKDLGEAMRILLTGDFRRGIFGMKEDDPFINALIHIHNAFVDMKNAAVAVFEYLKPSLEAAYDAVVNRLWPSIMQLYNTLEPGLTTALKVIAAVLGVLFVAAIRIALVALDAIVSTLGFMIRVISDVIGWIGNIGGAFINVAKGVPDAFSNIGNAILSPFKWAFDEIAKFWNATVGKLSFKAPSWVPGLGGKGWDMPDLPVLDTGGVVSQPTLAMLAANSRPEAIIPLDKMGGMGGQVNITVQAGAFMGSQIDARKYATQILKALQDMAAAKNTTVGNLIGVNP
jgi:hypothetical protein